MSLDCAQRDFASTDKVGSELFDSLDWVLELPAPAFPNRALDDFVALNGKLCLIINPKLPRITLTHPFNQSLAGKLLSAIPSSPMRQIQRWSTTNDRLMLLQKLARLLSDNTMTKRLFYQLADAIGINQLSHLAVESMSWTHNAPAVSAFKQTLLKMTLQPFISITFRLFRRR